MSEQDFNDFEDRLAAMRPAEPSPEIKRRVAESLEADRGHDNRPLIFRRPLGIALTVAAAIVFALVLLPFIGQISLRSPVAVDPAPSVPGSEDESVTPDATPNHAHPIRPTLLVMHQALRQSPEALDELIDRSGQLALAQDSSTPQPVPIAAEMWQWVHREELQ